MSPIAKTIKAHVCSATNPTTFPRKLKIAPTTLPTIASNASTAFPTSLLSALLACLTIFSRFPYLLMENLLPPPPPPKTSVMAKTIVEMVIERAISIEDMVILCSRIKVGILSAKDVSVSIIFSRVYLILVTCVWRSFRFCDSISILACFSVFRSSNLSLYNCFCSSE